MAKKQSPVHKIEQLQPDELGELRKLVQEYIRRDEELEGQITGLKEDQKALEEEFAEKLDLKTLKQAIKLLRLESQVAHKDAFDCFVEALKDPTQ